MYFMTSVHLRLNVFYDEDLGNEADDHDRDLLENDAVLFLVEARQCSFDLAVARLHPGTH